MKRFLIILAFVCPFANSIVAQEINLSEVWMSYSAKYSINKKWRVYGETQWRINNHSALSNPFFLEFGGRKKLNKVSSIKFQYRYTWIKAERNTQRLAIDGRFRWKVWDKKLLIQYRTRLQVERVNYNGQVISDWRNKVGIERKFSKRFFMYFDYESFIRLLKLKSFIRNDSPRFNKNRYTLGAKYKLKKNELKAFYRIDQGLNFPNELIHIFGFAITRKLK